VTCSRSLCRRLLWLSILLLLSTPAAAQFNPSQFDSIAGKTVTEISLSGNKITKEYVIFREIQTQMGEPLDLKTLSDDVVRLENLSIFSSIQVYAAESDSGVAVGFSVREMPWIIPYPAVSYNEVNGWSIGLGGTSINLLGRAIAAKGSVLFGGTTQVDLRFFYPWITGNHVSLEVLVRHLERDDKLNQFDEKSNEITPIVGTYLGKAGRGELITSWFQMNSNVSGKTLDPDDTDDLFRLGLSLGYDTRDSWRNPHQGWLLEGSAIKTGGILPGVGDFWSGVVDVRRYQPAYKGNTLVIGGLYTPQSGVVGSDIPEYLQYYMGGPNSIRGYVLEELGPELFGKSQLILTTADRGQIIPGADSPDPRIPAFQVGGERGAAVRPARRRGDGLEQLGPAGR
jgi:outer membrane protein insertion porin family